ncbi:MAG: methylated-DNA--[protein]-cysteine S-methyltransferase [Rhodothermaceae bacterium]
MICTTFESPVGEIAIAGDENGISSVQINTGEGKKGYEIVADWKRDNIFFAEAVKQLKEYFDGKRVSFDLKLNPKGTDFQKLIWHQLLKIPFGETRSYKDIAVAAGQHKASRAVGAANGKNPISLIVPCHRVIGSNGKLTGYARGLKTKEQLLNFEKSVVNKK